MSSPHPHVRRNRSGWRLAMLLALMGILVPGTLWAHAHLVKSTPAANARLAAPPDALHLWFSEAPELAFTRIALLGPSGDTVSTGAVAKDSANPLAVSVAIPTALPAGRYTVSWHTAAADGHPTHGTFTFTVLPGMGTATAASGATTPADTGSAAAKSGAVAPGSEGTAAPAMPPTAGAASATFDTSSPLYVVVRAVSFVALLVLLGVVSFHLLVLGALHRRNALDASVLERAAGRAAWLGAGAAIALLIANVARLYAESYAVYGAADDPGMEQMRAMLGHTVWGWGWIVQAAAALIAVALFFSAARKNTRGGWTAATVAVIALAFTPALSGHAAASPELKPLAILIDGVHVIGAGGWLGTLLVVVLVGIPVGLTLGAQRGRAIADMVNAFSPLALTFAGLTAVTGLVNAWLRLGTLPALWQSAYGRTLIVKLAILSLVVATGAYNWRRVRPTLGDDEGARRIRRSATVELAIGLAVILVTAVLVATPTPMEAGVRSESVVQ